MWCLGYEEGVVDSTVVGNMVAVDMVGVIIMAAVDIMAVVDVVKGVAVDTIGGMGVMETVDIVGG